MGAPPFDLVLSVVSNEMAYSDAVRIEAKEKQITEFCSVAGVEKDVAQLFLMDSKWNLQVLTNVRNKK